MVNNSFYEGELLEKLSTPNAFGVARTILVKKDFKYAVFFWTLLYQDGPAELRDQEFRYSMNYFSTPQKARRSAVNMTKRLAQ